MKTRLLEIRKKSGLTQMALAAAAQVNCCRLCVWELGAGRPNQRNALKLAKALNVEVTAIFPNFSELRKF